MARFLHHEPCPKCGSRNNFGRYDDGGGFCFGCHYIERATHAPMRNMGAAGSRDKYHHPLPDDVSTQLGGQAVEWLARFHLDMPTAIRRDIVWSHSREQLIFKLGNCWQARNFAHPGSNSALGILEKPLGKRSKNFTSGDVNECLHVFGSTDGGATRLVIVEDPVSAIRIAESGARSDSMPLLGSHLATARLNAVAGLYKGSEIVVWLDSDKYKEAQGIAARAKYMGLSTRVIWTEEDPKCYTQDELKGILQ